MIFEFEKQLAKTANAHPCIQTVGYNLTPHMLDAYIDLNKTSNKNRSDRISVQIDRLTGDVRVWVNAVLDKDQYIAVVEFVDVVVSMSKFFEK